MYKGVSVVNTEVICTGVVPVLFVSALGKRPQIFTPSPTAVPFFPSNGKKPRLFIHGGVYGVHKGVSHS